MEILLIIILVLSIVFVGCSKTINTQDKKEITTVMPIVTKAKDAIMAPVGYQYRKATPEELQKYLGKAAASRAIADNTEHYIICSPFVQSIYYAAPNPGTQTFVKVGTVVSKRQTLCLLETMKMFHGIESPYTSATVSALCKRNEDTVAYNEPIILLKDIR